MTVAADRDASKSKAGHFTAAAAVSHAQQQQQSCSADDDPFDVAFPASLPLNDDDDDVSGSGFTLPAGMASAVVLRETEVVASPFDLDSNALDLDDLHIAYARLGDKFVARRLASKKTFQ